MFTVLYVDDEPGLLEIGKLFLERDGQFNVDTITSAPAALALMDTKVYDAIIADYQMPDMDGIQFLKKVRISGNTIPFILFTGRGREEIVIQALNEGADFYLQKGGDPLVQFTELAHQVRQAVQQRRAEASIRDHERREADIINFLPDATFAIDTTGTVIAWNHAMEGMTGVKPAEILGKNNYEYAIPFYHKRRPILIDLVLAPDEKFEREKYLYTVHDITMLTAETILEKPGGAPVHLWVKACRLFDKNGNLVGAIESIRDITRQKQAEEALRESEERFAAFMDHLPVSAFIKDEQFTSLFVNRQMEEIFGAREWIGKSVHELFPGDAAEKMTEDDRQTLVEGSQKIIETLAGKNGKRKIFETYKFRIDRENKPPLIGGFAVDITEQKEVEKALNESEERFRKIFENSPLGMTLVTPDFRFSSVNPAWVSMTGYSEEELLKMSFKDITHPEHLAGDMEHMQELVAGTIPVYSTEKQYIRKDGSILWGLIRVTNIRNQQGSLRYFAAQIEDITDRKLAEKELRESEERYRNVVEDQTELISRFLPDGTHVFVNAAYCRYFGLKRDEILGHRFRPKIPAEDQERVRQFFESLTLDHPVDSIEHRIIMPDDSIRWQRWSDRAIFDPAGTISEYQSVGQDITGQKQEEQALHENEQRLNSIYNTVGDIIFQLTVEPGGQFYFSSVNSAFSSITGLPSGQVIGKKVSEIIPEPSLTMVLEKYRQAIQEKTIVRWEETSVYPTGQVTGEVSIAPIFDKEGHCTHLIGSVHDITGRKRMEEALRESEAKYRLLADTSPEMIYLVDPEGRVQYVNRLSARVFRTTPENLVGKHLTDLFPPDVARHHLEAIRTVISTRQPSIYEGTEVLPSGKIWIDVRLSPMIDNENRVIGVLGLSNDITQRKSAEEALRQSEVRFRMIFENQQNGLIMVNAETHVIVDANRTALSLMGATRDDVIGRVCHTFICPAEKGKCPVTDLGHTVDMSERFLLNIKGERIPIIKSVSRITLGNRTYLIESFTDITEGKRAEEALRASEEKYHGIFENTTVAVFQTRIDGSIATANPAFARLLKYETPEIAIREIPSIRAIYVDPDVRDELYRLVVTQGVVDNFELALRRRDGSILWASVNVRAVRGDDGKVTGLEGLAVDITDRKNTEEALREVNKKLSLLSRITRHDINNQLMVLRAYLEILKEKQPDPSFTAPFQKAVNAAQRISSMIQFTREYEEIGVNAPVWQDCHALADTAAKDAPLGKIALKNDLPSGTEVFADPLIVKVFYNLMDNAIRYGRKITTIRFSLQESGEDHQIVCEDDGDGISADEKERIFERDFGRNTGLGLFLSREVLAITGITIRETGVPGKGARFEMTVPKNAYRLTVTEQA